MSDGKSEHNPKLRALGDRKVSTVVPIDDLVILLLATVKIDSGDILSDKELNALNRCTYNLIERCRPFYRFKKNRLPKDIKIPILTKSSDPISLSEAVNKLKEYSSTWRDVLGEENGLVRKTS